MKTLKGNLRVSEPTSKGLPKIAKNHVHILAICGYTTSGLALMAKKLGFKVTGSDEDAYPPVTDLITKNKIPWNNFHDPRNLSLWGKPDLVIQGNQIREGNTELSEAKRLGIRIISDSEFFYYLTKERTRIAVCGSHGKTTVSALITWILEVAGRKPGFRLGTVTKNFDCTVSLGSGSEFVFEGDEYTTTFDDSRPKFYHFHPNVAIINNIEWDHPDVYKNEEGYVAVFKKYLVKGMPKNGLLVVNAEDKSVRKIVEGAVCRVVWFGLETGNYRVGKVKHQGGGTVFTIMHQGKDLGQFTCRLPGLHNVKNCLAAIAAGHELGIGVPDLKKAVASFAGTSRRFEIIEKVRGITVIDDYAHHPTKARETIAAARQAFPKARIFAIYVPHTYSRTKALLPGYLHAFDGADFVVIPDIEPARERHLAALINSRDLVSQISAHKKNVYYIPDQKDLLDFIAGQAKRGDIILCMSVRGFNDLAKNMAARLWKKV